MFSAAVEIVLMFLIRKFPLLFFYLFFNEVRNKNGSANVLGSGLWVNGENTAINKTNVRPIVHCIWKYYYTMSVSMLTIKVSSHLIMQIGQTEISSRSVVFFILTLWGRVTHWCVVGLYHHWFRLFFYCMVPSHYLKLFRLIVNHTSLDDVRSKPSESKLKKMH